MSRGENIVVGRVLGVMSISQNTTSSTSTKKTDQVEMQGYSMPRHAVRVMLIVADILGSSSGSSIIFSCSVASHLAVQMFVATTLD